jgi:hypothetical protein
MTELRLTITVEVGSAEEAKELINVLKSVLPAESKLALVRDGDRSAGNLLLPLLQGRFGEHLQGRKALLSEL